MLLCCRITQLARCVCFSSRNTSASRFSRSNEKEQQICWSRADEARRRFQFEALRSIKNFRENKHKSNVHLIESRREASAGCDDDDRVRNSLDVCSSPFR